MYVVFTLIYVEFMLSSCWFMLMHTDLCWIVLILYVHVCWSMLVYVDFMLVMLIFGWLIFIFITSAVRMLGFTIVKPAAAWSHPKANKAKKLWFVLLYVNLNIFSFFFWAGGGRLSGCPPVPEISRFHSRDICFW